MITETEGIVLRQTKTAYGRRMICLLTKKYGKISAGTSISEGGKNKAALAIRPFTHGRYELFKGRDAYSINGAETIDSFFSLGEDIDKYSYAAASLELCDRLLEEEQQSQGMYSLLLDYLSILEKRKKDFGTLYIAYRIKALELSGSGIQTENCVKCGKGAESAAISVSDGGAICKDCCDSLQLNPLIFAVSNDIIKIIQFMQSHPIRSLENLTLPAEKQALLMKIVKAFYHEYLGIDTLKSEMLLI